MANQVTPRELEIAQTGPAVLVNRFVVTIGPLVRLVFLEGTGDAAPQFRAAAAMTREDAVALAELLSELLATDAMPRGPMLQN